jgi:AraC-like DNA-binding protein
LLDALLRLIRLLDTPRDIAMLAPLIRREILYRLLRGPQGYRLYEIALANSQTHRVCQAITWLNNNYQQPLRIEDLAREVNLSTSTLHHRFKAVTSMSPLQYQKQLRLQEARRLMLNDGLEAAVAAYRVGMKARRSSAVNTAGFTARRRFGMWPGCGLLAVLSYWKSKGRNRLSATSSQHCFATGSGQPGSRSAPCAPTPAPVLPAAAPHPPHSPLPRPTPAPHR